MQDELERNEKELQSTVSILAFTPVSYAPVIEELLTQQEHLQQRLAEAKATEQLYQSNTKKLKEQLKADGRPPVTTDKRPPFPRNSKVS